MRKKRGIFFSTDALVALFIILILLLIVYPQFRASEHETSISSDILKTLSSLKIKEVQSSTVQSWIAQGVVDPEKAVIDQIGILAITNPSLAKNLTGIVLQKLETPENIGIWYDNSLIFSLNSTSFAAAKNVNTERYIVSGIGGLNGTGMSTGFSARGFLASGLRTQYYYLGGYVGDGNLTLRAEYYGNVSSAEMELAINNNFTLYINGVASGAYAASPSEFVPAAYNLDLHKQNFISGANLIEFKGDNLHIAGGFVRINYISDVNYSQQKRYYFPGVQGILNVYDGFSTPSVINEMNIFLHYNSPYEAFLNIGNITVWNGSSAGDATASIQNSQLSTLLNYPSLSNKTIPLRFGSKNASIFINATGNADVILITDTSGSMDWRLNSGAIGTARNCGDPMLTDPTTKRISLAKCIDQDFVLAILNGTNNKVGLVSFANSANSYVNLTTDISLLNNTINAYAPSGSTCVSCAINRAYLLLKDTDPTRKKFIITMTDGVTNVRSTSVCYDVKGSGDDPSSVISSQVGSSGAIAQYSNSQWRAMTSPTASQINNMDFLNSTLGFAAASSYQIFKWNGNSWALQQDLGTQNLYGINLFNSTLGFAVGDSGKIAKWNGVSWSEYQDTGNDGFRDVKIFNSTLGFAVGDVGKIFRWTGGSSLWSEYADIGNQDLKAVDIFSGNYGLAVGTSGEIYVWNGNSWSMQQDLGSSTLTDVDIFNSTLAFATSTDNRIYRKLGSSSWSSNYQAAVDMNTILIFNSSLGFAAGAPAEGVVFWNGAVWNNTYPGYYYQGNSTNGLSCSDIDSCSEYETAPMLNANYSSCRANSDINATVHSVGFGPVTTCAFSEKTLRAIASCGNGSYYASDNATQLQQIYQNISQSILQFSYFQQTAINAGGNASGILYPDSYIEFNYTEQPTPFGLILGIEKKFSDASSGVFEIPQGSKLLDTRTISYSGPRWTDNVKINNVDAYKLSNYGINYILLGDPYSIEIPIGLVSTTMNNTINLTTGLSPTNVTSGSAENKIIYTIAKNFSAFSPITPSAEGCIWTIQFEDWTNLTTAIPSGYNGTSLCYYTYQQQVYSTNDALQVAVYNLLRELDFDLDNLVDVKFSQQSFSIDLSQITGIPYTWHTEVQVRTWS